MADRVYLHIGAPKTGTSYLQLLIWNNRARLKEQGIHLPLRKRRNHFDAVADLRGGIWAQKWISRTWDQLAASVARTEGVAVVSEELLCATPLEQRERIMESLAPAEVHVVLTARDIGRQVPASWQQLVRGRGVSTYESFIQEMRDHTKSAFWTVQDPVSVYRRWGPMIGKGHFHLVTVPPAGSPAGLLWERFASVIGADPARAEAPSRNQNESLGLVETELLRRFNAQLGDDFPMRGPYIDNVRRWMTVPALMGVDNERIGVPDIHAAWLRERSAEMVGGVEALRGELDLVGAAGDLFAEVRPATRAPQEITDSELLERALRSWTRQLHFLEEREADRLETFRAERDGVRAERSLGYGRRAARKLRRVAARVRR